VSFAQLPRPIQVQLAAIGPLLFGLVCGFLLEINAVAYWGASALSVVGGLVGGAEHAAVRPAALRGAAAGTCFGLGVVIANAASKGQPLAPLPSPTALLILITAIAGTGLAATGAWLTGRRRHRQQRRQADHRQGPASERTTAA
jgi:hypothetical protein